MADRPNILFIMADQLGAASLGCYGSGVDSTPTLDALAAQGVRFDRCYATSPVCAPNRASIITGRYPSATRVRSNHNAADATYQADLIDVLREQAIARGDTDPRFHALTRPPELEGEAVNRAIQLARVAGDAPLYIVHLSAAQALEEVAEARHLGSNVFAETCPQYLTLTQEIMGGSKAVEETGLFADLEERYIYNIKEKVLEPFLDNENFRRAIKDYDEEDFKTYDQKIREDVTYLMNNLMERYRYTEQGAKAVCIYVIDNDLARKFT